MQARASLHIMSNGGSPPVRPSAVFGDATRESVVVVFERMQSHPWSAGSDTCPCGTPIHRGAHPPMGRGVLSFHARRPGDSAPPARRTPWCDPPEGRHAGHRAVIVTVRPWIPYRSIEFTAGNALLGPICRILGRVPPVRTSSSGRTGCWLPEDRGSGALCSFPVRAIRVMSLCRCGTPGGLGDALGRIGPHKAGPPCALYMRPARRRRPGDGDHAVRLGVERIYLFRRDLPIAANAVALLRRALGQSRLAWVRRDGSPFETD